MREKVIVPRTRCATLVRCICVLRIILTTGRLLRVLASDKCVVWCHDGATHTTQKTLLFFAPVLLSGSTFKSYDPHDPHILDPSYNHHQWPRSACVAGEEHTMHIYGMQVGQAGVARPSEAHETALADRLRLDCLPHLLGFQAKAHGTIRAMSTIASYTMRRRKRK